MLGFLKNPHAFVIAVALLTATIAHFYSRTTDKDPQTHRKTFWKTLVIGILSGLLLTWLVHGQSEPLTSEPFNTEI